jgi:HPt (histidine-containing phosphotransfer) domain-containing protein
MPPVQFDRAAVLANLDGDIELLREIAGIYLESYGNEIARISAAIAAADASAVYTLTHTLKGSAGNFGATELIAAARAIEQQSRQGRLDAVAADFEQLRELLEQLAAELRELVGTDPGDRPRGQTPGTDPG